MEEQKVENRIEKIKVDLSYLPKINFALQQNAIPVIREIVLTNKIEKDLQFLDCKFSSTPEFLVETVKRIDLLSANKSFSFYDFNLNLNYKFLAELSERLQGQINLLFMVWQCINIHILDYLAVNTLFYYSSNDDTIY